MFCHEPTALVSEIDGALLNRAEELVDMINDFDDGSLPILPLRTQQSRNLNFVANLEMRHLAIFNSVAKTTVSVILRITLHISPHRNVSVPDPNRDVGGPDAKTHQSARGRYRRASVRSGHDRESTPRGRRRERRNTDGRESMGPYVRTKVDGAHSRSRPPRGSR